MADYKVVDAEQLNADLSSVADAIRDRAKTTESMSFPDDFVSKINSITDYLSLRAQGKLTEYANDEITELVTSAFAAQPNLTKVSLPNWKSGGWYAFQNGRSLKSMVCPSLLAIGSYCFSNCSALEKVDFHVLKSSEGSIFNNCTSLATVIIRSSAVCTLVDANAFTGSAIAKGTGYIYVPRALVDSYKSATNWSTYASQFRAIEDYPEITGGAA